MPAKTHIKLKRGLVTQKHRHKMNACIWLFLYILDRTDWNSATVTGWKDREAAAWFGVSLPTVRGWRRSLEEEGYIAYRKSVHDGVIHVHNWLDPRQRWGGAVEQRPAQGEDQRIPQNAKEAYQHPDLALFREITGVMPGERDYEAAILALRMLRAQHGGAVKAYLTRFWAAWTGRKRQSDGQPYSRTNVKWLTEWALNDYIPPEKVRRGGERREGEILPPGLTPEQVRAAQEARCV